MTAEPSDPVRVLTGGRTARISADSDDVGRGLGQLVVAVLELVRDLLERQAIRRVEGGTLTSEETERLGRGLQLLEERLAELRDTFGVEPGGLRLPVEIDDLISNMDAKTRISSPTHVRSTYPGGSP